MTAINRGDLVKILKNNTSRGVSCGSIQKPVYKKVEKDLVGQVFKVASTLDGEVCNIETEQKESFTFEDLSCVQRMEI